MRTMKWILFDIIFISVLSKTITQQPSSDISVNKLVDYINISRTNRFKEAKQDILDLLKNKKGSEGLEHVSTKELLSSSLTRDLGAQNEPQNKKKHSPPKKKKLPLINTVMTKKIDDSVNHLSQKATNPLFKDLTRKPINLSEQEKHKNNVLSIFDKSLLNKPFKTPSQMSGKKSIKYYEPQYVKIKKIGKTKNLSPKIYSRDPNYRHRQSWEIKFNNFINYLRSQLDQMQFKKTYHQAYNQRSLDDFKDFSTNQFNKFTNSMKKGYRSAKNSVSKSWRKSTNYLKERYKYFSERFKNFLQKTVDKLFKRAVTETDKQIKSTQDSSRNRRSTKTRQGYNQDPETCKRYNENLDKMWSELSKYINSTKPVDKSVLHNIVVMIEAYLEHQDKNDKVEVTRIIKKHDKINKILKKIKKLLGKDKAVEKIHKMVIENFKPEYTDDDPECKQTNEDNLSSSIALSYKYYLDNAKCHGDFDTGLLRGKALLRQRPSSTTENVPIYNYGYSSEHIEPSILDENESTKDFFRNKIPAVQRYKQRSVKKRRATPRESEFINPRNSESRRQILRRKNTAKKKSKRITTTRSDNSCVKYASRKFLITLRTSIERFVGLRDCQRDDTLRTSDNVFARDKIVPINTNGPKYNEPIDTYAANNNLQMDAYVSNNKVPIDTNVLKYSDRIESYSLKDNVPIDINEPRYDELIDAYSANYNEPINTNRPMYSRPIIDSYVPSGDVSYDTYAPRYDVLTDTSYNEKNDTGSLNNMEASDTNAPNDSMQFNTYAVNYNELIASNGTKYNEPAESYALKDNAPIDAYVPSDRVQINTYADNANEPIDTYVSQYDVPFDTYTPNDNVPIDTNVPKYNDQIDLYALKDNMPIDTDIPRYDMSIDTYASSDREQTNNYAVNANKLIDSNVPEYNEAIDLYAVKDDVAITTDAPRHDVSVDTYTNAASVDELIDSYALRYDAPINSEATKYTESVDFYAAKDNVPLDVPRYDVPIDTYVNKYNESIESNALKDNLPIDTDEPKDVSVDTYAQKYGMPMDSNAPNYDGPIYSYATKDNVPIDTDVPRYDVPIDTKVTKYNESTDSYAMEGNLPIDTDRPMDVSLETYTQKYDIPMDTYAPNYKEPIDSDSLKYDGSIYSYATKDKVPLDTDVPSYNVPFDTYAPKDSVQSNTYAHNDNKLIDTYVSKYDGSINSYATNDNVPFDADVSSYDVPIDIFARNNSAQINTNAAEYSELINTKVSKSNESIDTYTSNDNVQIDMPNYDKLIDAPNNDEPVDSFELKGNVPSDSYASGYDVPFDTYVPKFNVPIGTNTAEYNQQIGSTALKDSVPIDSYTNKHNAPIDLYVPNYNLPINTHAPYNNVQIDSKVLEYNVPIETYAPNYNVPIDTNRPNHNEPINSYAPNNLQVNKYESYYNVPFDNNGLKFNEQIDSYAPNNNVPVDKYESNYNVAIDNNVPNYNGPYHTYVSNDNERIDTLPKNDVPTNMYTSHYNGPIGSYLSDQNVPINYGPNIKLNEIKMESLTKTKSNKKKQINQMRSIIGRTNNWNGKTSRHKIKKSMSVIQTNGYKNPTAFRQKGTKNVARMLNYQYFPPTSNNYVSKFNIQKSSSSSNIDLQALLNSLNLNSQNTVYTKNIAIPDILQTNGNSYVNLYDTLKKKVEDKKINTSFDALARENKNNPEVEPSPTDSVNDDLISTNPTDTANKVQIDFNAAGDILKYLQNAALSNSQLNIEDTGNEKGYVELSYLIKYPKSIVYRPQYLVKNILKYDDFIKVANHLYITKDDKQLLKIVRHLPDNSTQTLFETEDLKLPFDLIDNKKENTRSRPSLRLRLPITNSVLSLGQNVNNQPGSDHNLIRIARQGSMTDAPESKIKEDDLNLHEYSSNFQNQNNDQFYQNSKIIHNPEKNLELHEQPLEIEASKNDSDLNTEPDNNKYSVDSNLNDYSSNVLNLSLTSPNSTDVKRHAIESNEDALQDKESNNVDPKSIADFLRFINMKIKKVDEDLNSTSQAYIKELKTQEATSSSFNENQLRNRWENWKNKVIAQVQTLAIKLLTLLKKLTGRRVQE